ncbi:hypothetical protein AAHE18_19G106900 [Arachis hypogaea]
MAPFFLEEPTGHRRRRSSIFSNPALASFIHLQRSASSSRTQPLSVAVLLSFSVAVQRSPFLLLSFSPFWSSCYSPFSVAVLLGSLCRGSARFSVVVLLAVLLEASENLFKGNLTSLPKPGGGEFGKFYSLPSLKDPRVDKLPYCIRILESAIRNCNNFQVKKEDVEKIIDWENTSKAS